MEICEATFGARLIAPTRAPNRIHDRSLSDDAQLLDHSKKIPADPFLYDFSVLDPVDGYTHPSGAFVSRLEAHQYALMCSR